MQNVKDGRRKALNRNQEGNTKTSVSKTQGEVINNTRRTVQNGGKPLNYKFIPLEMGDHFSMECVYREYYAEIIAVDITHKIVHIKDGFGNSLQYKLEKGRSGLAKFKFRGSDYYISTQDNCYTPFKVSCQYVVYMGTHLPFGSNIFTFYKVKDLGKDNIHARFLAY